MLIKNPFLNVELFQNARHCYIAAKGISEIGFELFLSKLDQTCKVDILTTLSSQTPTTILRKILAIYKDRVRCRVCQDLLVERKTYLFDLLSGERIAYVSLPNFNLAGFEKYENTAYQITRETEESLGKIITSLDNTFRNSLQLTKEMVGTLELERDGKQQALPVNVHKLRWILGDLSKHYFKSTHYRNVDNIKRSGLKIHNIRMTAKFRELRKILTSKLVSIQSNAVNELSGIEFKIDSLKKEGKIYAIWLACFRKTGQDKSPVGQLQIIIRRQNFGIWLVVPALKSLIETQMVQLNKNKKQKLGYAFVQLTRTLDQNHYWIDSGGDTRLLKSFKTTSEFWRFVGTDHSFSIIGRDFEPSAPQLLTARIFDTIVKELTHLLPLYDLVNRNDLR